jgi:cell wall-associated NlpC family hydrolase
MAIRELPVRAQVVGVAVLALALFAVVPTPAGADPGSTVPDSGSRPTAIGGLALPGQGGGVPGATFHPQTPVIGPLAIQILAEETAVESLGEQLKQAEETVATAQTAVSQLELRLRSAQSKAAQLRQRQSSAASDAFKWANQLGPFDSYASQLHELTRLAPGITDGPGGQALAIQVKLAEDEIRAAAKAYEDSDAAARTAASHRDLLKASFNQRSTALATLKTQNAAELTKVEAERDAYEQSLGSSTLGEINADGMTSNPKALDAVKFALSQLGVPYLWGAEGPNRYDCSGLMLAAYRSVGVTLPRIANEQFHSSPAVTSTRTSRGDLLVPGDMVFFSDDLNDWTKIHHVGMYIGSGKMVHAPSTGDVVKISSVHWSEFFGAVRIFPAVPAPKPGPSAAPPVSGQPTPSSPGVSHPSGGGTSVSPAPPTSSAPSSPAPPTNPPPSSSAPSGGGSSSAAPSSSGSSNKPGDSDAAKNEAGTTGIR